MLKNTPNNLGVKFNNPALLSEAFTHRSYLNEHAEIKNSNERLEFLGDSVLQVITSTELYLRFPELPEGRLTSLRSNLVRTKTLAQVALKLNLGAFLLMCRGEEKGGARQNHSLLANTFEALLGAIYRDAGLPGAKAFLKTQIFSMIETVSQEKEIFDFKSRLQEAVQEEKRSSPVYKVITEIGPDHDKVFTIGVFINNKLQAQGQGKSKQEGEQDAARLALREIDQV